MYFWGIKEIWVTKANWCTSIEVVPVQYQYVYRYSTGIIPVLCKSMFRTYDGPPAVFASVPERAFRRRKDIYEKTTHV